MEDEKDAVSVVERRTRVENFLWRSVVKVLGSYGTEAGMLEGLSGLFPRLAWLVVPGEGKGKEDGGSTGELLHAAVRFHGLTVLVEAMVEVLTEEDVERIPEVVDGLERMGDGEEGEEGRTWMGSMSEAERGMLLELVRERMMGSRVLAFRRLAVGWVAVIEGDQEFLLRCARDDVSVEIRVYAVERIRRIWSRKHGAGAGKAIRSGAILDWIQGPGVWDIPDPVREGVFDLLMDLGTPRTPADRTGLPSRDKVFCILLSHVRRSRFLNRLGGMKLIMVVLV